MPSGFPIGEAARRSGCTVATIRYYEDMGLIGKATRNDGGRRVFTRPDIEKLRLVRRLRALEFAIDEIKELVSAMNGGDCLNVRDIAVSQLNTLRERRAEIDLLERTLSGLAGACSSICADGPSPDCTIVQDIATARR
jgi:DNA-binding transcriptional MerR regulator